jgi:homopolymeric O-antigen transport system permease protein
VTEAIVTIIRPKQGLLDFELRSVWRYRDLLLLFAMRDIKIRYKQTLLGPAWLILQPLAFTGVFTAMISGVIGLSTDNQPAPLFYLCALVVWSYFSQTVQSIALVFRNNWYLFSKIYFPRIIVPLATIISAGAGLGIQAALVLIFVLLYVGLGHSEIMTWHIFLFPFIGLHLAFFSLAIGIWIANSTAKYRDLANMTPFLIQLWLFLTPVIFPFSAIPEGYRTLVSILNPLAALVEMTRWCFLGVATVTWLDVIGSLVSTTLCLVTGLLLFRRIERNAVDTI